MAFSLDDQHELAPGTPVQLGQVRSPQYGRYLDDFTPGEVFVHPRGYTFERSAMRDFATTFMQTNPLYLNQEFAIAHGFHSIPACPQMVFNIVLSLGVQNDSEKAVANLGYYQAKFLEPVYAGDTLRAYTDVVSRRDRGPSKPGIAHIRTLGVNQHDRVVLQYERKIMVRWRGDSAKTSPNVVDGVTFPWVSDPSVELTATANAYPTGLTGSQSYAEDFSPGDIIVHANGRTITDEHVFLTYQVGNTHPLHVDRLYSLRQKGKMSGEPIVYGGLVFAWLDGLASRDVSENALWELSFTEGYHTQPAFSGDTVTALTRILRVDEAPEAFAGRAKVVSMQLIGFKNIDAQAALDTYGADIFIKEKDKKKLEKPKIEQKVFEIERRLLIKSRP